VGGPLGASAGNEDTRRHDTVPSSPAVFESGHVMRTVLLRRVLPPGLTHTGATDQVASTYQQLASRGTMPADRVLPDAVVADATVRRWGRCFADVDRRMVRSCRALRPRVARIALALVYLWFGLVKLTGHSDAGPLAAALTARTIGSAHFALAFNTLAVFECLIGIVVLVRRARALVPPLIGLHLAVVCSPLVLVPDGQARRCRSDTRTRPRC